jgi:NadR type nicotinamide-nucleotide adenylyltransferase
MEKDVGGIYGMSASVQRIAVYGPESTGKTQLAEQLAAHFNEPLVAEYARERWDEQGALSLEDMMPVAREQWRREDAAVARAKRVVICDTDALTTMLWSDLLYGTTPEELRRGAEARCRNYAIYLLLDIDVPFAPDPQRCFPNPDDREKAMRIWRGALDRRGLPYRLIQGNWAERERAAIRAIESILKPDRT